MERWARQGEARNRCRCGTGRRALAALLILSLRAGAAWGACAVTERVSVPLEPAGGRLMVTMTLDDQPAHFVLDTGAGRSLITPEAVARLRLRLDDWVDSTVMGVGGYRRHRNADPRSIALGGLALHRRTLTQDTSLTVGILPGGGVADGLLGRDFLSLYDVMIDPVAGRLALFDVRGCAGRFLPWRGAYTAVPATVPMGQALVFEAQVDGRGMRAMLDTGAYRSLVTAPGMVRLGLTEASVAGDPQDLAHGVGPLTVRMPRHLFASLSVGGDVLRDPSLLVAMIHVLPMVDLILGADWLAGRRVWLSYATKQVFAGGPE
jgi:hypothetical protein